MDNKDLNNIKKLITELDYSKYVSFDEKKITSLEKELKKIEVSLLENAHKREIIDKSTYIPYPDLDDPQFYNKLMNKKEFSYITLNSKSECENNSKKIILTNNQQFLKNYMSPFTQYNSLLLFHSVGVGKTLSAISMLDQEESNRKIIVIMPTNLKNNFLRQIFDINYPDRPIGKKYYKMVNTESLSKEMIEKQVYKLIKKKYKFYGFIEFAIMITNLLEGITDNAKKDRILQSKFQNCDFIIDEVHNIRMTTEFKLVPPIILSVLKNTNKSKLVLLSATPMFNEAEEIIELLNLLFANDKKPLLKKSDIFDNNGKNLTPEGREKLKNVSKGYISYMYGGNPEKFPIRLYPSHTNEREYYYCDVSQKQKKFYAEVLKDENFKNNVQIMLQISNIIYGTDHKNWKSVYGEEGFKNCFQVEKSIYKYKKQPHILDFNHIADYAPKIYNILKCIQKSEGIIFVHSFFIHSGVVPIAIALEHLGYNRYNAPNLLGTKKTSNANNYVILSPNVDFTPESLDDYVQILRSEKNKNGEKIKVILGSSVAAEGLDLRNIREVHFLEPWFHFNKMEQVIGRAVRTCSHIDLEKEKRNVTIYHHVNQLHETYSIDVKTYEDAEKKQKTIKEIEDILINSSIDCSLNSPSFTTPSKIIDLTTSDNTKIKIDVSKYFVKKTDCIAPKISEPNDNSTFRFEYIKSDIVHIISDIELLFKKKGIYDLEEIEKAMSHIDKNILYHSLEEMLVEKNIFQNSEDELGYMVYLGNKYMFQPKDDTITKFSVSKRMHYKKPIDTKINMKKNVNKEISNETILERIDKRVKNLHDSLKLSAVDSNVLIDYVVDRLQPDELKELVLSLDYSDSKCKLCKSLKNAGIIHITKEIIFFRNPFDDNIYKIENAEIYKTNLLEIAKLPAISGIENDVLKGYIYCEQLESSNYAFFFKYIKDGVKSDGTICEKTSTLKKDEIMFSNEPDIKRTKAEYCVLLEIHLRLLKTGFARNKFFKKPRQLKRKNEKHLKKNNSKQ